MGVKQTAEMEEAVAVEFITKRDSDGFDCPPPPGQLATFDTVEKAPVRTAGSFLIGDRAKGVLYGC